MHAQSRIEEAEAGAVRVEDREDEDSQSHREAETVQGPAEEVDNSLAGPLGMLAPEPPSAKDRAAGPEEAAMPAATLGRTSLSLALVDMHRAFCE